MLRARYALLLPFATGVLAAQGVPEEQVFKEMPGFGKVIDPDRDCEFSYNRIDKILTILVPAKAHLLSIEDKRLRMNAPRIMRDVEGNFAAMTRVMGFFKPASLRTSPLVPYQGAGLLLWQDAQNYVRLERSAITNKDETTRHIVNFEYRKAGRLLSSRAIDVSTVWSYLKFERHEDEISAAFSEDGEEWTSFPAITPGFANNLKVGLVAINSSKKKFAAEIMMYKVGRTRADLERL